MAVLGSAERRRILQQYTIALAIGAAIVAAIPALIAVLCTPAGSSYIGYQYNTDDHMVYAAWMRQAMAGHLLMDNRFAVDPQPGLTIHIYYFLLGLVAKVTGIAIATFLARIGFGFFFVWLLNRFLRRLHVDVHTHKLALGLSVIGGGLGFLVWHNFGVAIVRPTPELLRNLLLGGLPTDVWQPEGFVFPSMLTNSLFMVSLCLILVVLTALLDARNRPRAVLPGALAFLVLMNIHSYDVLLVAMTMVGFLAMAITQKLADPKWIGRAVLIGLGAVPAALWFVYVLKNDPVFQARAATETYSPNFREVVFGYLPMMALGLVSLAVGRLDEKNRTRRLAGLAVIVILFLGMFLAASGHDKGYFVDGPMWAVMFIAAIAGLVLVADENPAWNMVAAWAVIGTVAIYFPALFQRKLTMGLSIPWCILAAYGIHALLAKQERSSRNLATVLLLIVSGASSVRWLGRELLLVRANVSNTTVHPVYLTADMLRIRAYLNALSGRAVLVAPPGVPAAMVDIATNKAAPDEFGSPIMPDLNPILTGFTGVYSFAGHWSETPDYSKRRGLVQALFFSKLTDNQRKALVEKSGADYLVAPVPEAFQGLGLPDLRPLGQVAVEGTQFRLLKLPRHSGSTDGDQASRPE